MTAAQSDVDLLFSIWRNDPTTFCVDVLGFAPWEAEQVGQASQASIMRAVPHHKRVTVRSGHKIGKSRLAAALALWAFVCFPGARVILTAPTHRQIKEVVWREVQKLWRNALIPIGGTMNVDAGTGLRHPITDSQIVGFSTNEADRFSGISGEFVFYIADEASGIAELIFEAIEGNRAGGAWLVMLGNPTQTVGTFYDSHNAKSRFYKTFHVDSADVARMQANRIARGEKPIPGLAMPAWVEEKADEWGTDSSKYGVRVSGAFPDVGATSIVGRAHLQAAVDRWNGYDFTQDRRRLHVGVDVARFGDDETVITLRRGLHVYPQMVLPSGDGPSTAARIAFAIQASLYPAELSIGEKPLVKVDAIGVGASVYDSLRQMPQFDTLGINVAMKADVDDEYANLRAQLLFGIEGFFRNGGDCPDDETLQNDIAATNYQFDRQGRYQAEAKEKVKERLGRSPDRADSLALALYDASAWIGVRPARIANI